MACVNRVKKELDMLANDPGPGISAWPISDDNIMVLQVINIILFIILILME